MLTVVVWLYPSLTGHRHYTMEHVELFKRQFSANYHLPHQFHLLTAPDDTEKLENNYRRLWVFSEEAAELFNGTRIFTSDLDVMIVGDLTKYLSRIEPFVIMTDPTQKGANYKYSPSFLLDPGSRVDIWEAFMEEGSIDRMKKYYKEECGQKRVTGSDMAWLSYYLREEDVPTFNQYRARNLDCSNLPLDAKIIHFSGKNKPWEKIGEGRL